MRFFRLGKGGEQCDFVRSGFNSQLNGLILNKNQFFVAIAA
ncbi:hypothetical protein GXM_08347 [Nostoc sphaeroides CCNUC1]|uniref:Uncharacterized protein n=1 Tax=Nostoc sphaeroides CCNUC1 TaxID=2653204 RepID=A0A5P8WDF6_9NOSO|nr:hypothetical protein GXM_08347 [Nostoc sphaeroides CCNUC1]